MEVRCLVLKLPRMQKSNFLFLQPCSSEVLSSHLEKHSSFLRLHLVTRDLGTLHVLDVEHQYLRHCQSPADLRRELERGLKIKREENPITPVRSIPFPCSTPGTLSCLLGKTSKKFLFISIRVTCLSHGVCFGDGYLGLLL